MKIELVQSGRNQKTQWQSQKIDSEPVQAGAAKPGNGVSMRLIPSEEFQTMIGFGGAFTEASAYTLSRMSDEKRQEVLRRYFHPHDGLGYRIGRIPVHSCDFSLENYTYVKDGDESLESFDMSREEKWLLPLIRDAETVAGQPIRLLASPWSPPAWMKSNGEMNHGGSLLPEHRPTWARYLVRYIQEMQNKGFSLWGLSVQNEPAAVQTWDSCIYSAEEERDFVRDYLGPELEKAGLSDVKLLIWDHNRDIMVERARTVLEDPEAARYVWGVGFHWYVSEAFENVGEVHRLFPHTHLLFTEGCQEGGVHLGSWSTGERYARNMIGDFSNWCEGYLDWNIVLDERGGPNHVGNFCDAPVIADTTSDLVHLNSSYYYIGHFSRYVMPGAVRIGLESEGDSLPAVAFMNPDSSVAVVILNEGTDPVSYSLEMEGRKVECRIDGHSINTLVWKRIP